MKAGDDMAEISKELEDIRTKRFGVEIREQIHDALEKINTELEEKKKGSDKDG